MTVPQLTAFLVWYKTGLEGTGRRSLRKAARLTNHSLKTLVAWHEDFQWDDMAAEKDAEIQAELEETLVKSVLEAKKAILKRQRTVIAKLYARIYQAIDEIEIKLPDIIRLLEYEANLSGAGAGRVGGAFRDLLEALDSESRIAILTRYRSLRESGQFPGPRLGPDRIIPGPSRN